MAALESNDISQATSILMESIHSSVQPMKTPSTKNIGSSHGRYKSWYDQDCSQLKKCVNKSLNNFRNSRSSSSLKVYIDLKKEYKLLLNYKKNAFYEFEKQKLEMYSRQWNF